MFEPPRLRLALALGDQELEQRLRPALDGFDEVLVVAQCLAADQLLQVLDARQADAVVVAAHLHRLTDSVLMQLERPGVPVVLLVPEPDDERWRARRDPTLGIDADADAIREALLAARRGQRSVTRPRVTPERLRLKAADLPPETTAQVLAVTGGFGSPGRTTVAIGLAAALGSAAPTVLVELDLCACSVAAYLDRDPSRNICTLAHAVREDPRTWPMALQAELQPMVHRGSTADVLCGPPKREMRTSIAPTFVEQLIDELAKDYRWIVLDIGPELLGIEAAAINHRAALARAHQLLLVVGADLVGLWHARNALDQLEHQVGIAPEQVSLALNRHDPRHHHSRSEVQWHLGTLVSAVVPFDHRAAQRAISAQQPLVHDPTSHAGRALIHLAERLNEGKLRVPRHTAERTTRMSWWRRLWPRPRARTTLRSLPPPDRLPVASVPTRQGAAW